MVVASGGFESFAGANIPEVSSRRATPPSGLDLEAAAEQPIDATASNRAALAGAKSSISCLITSIIRDQPTGTVERGATTYFRPQKYELL
jgi:hypothetical protein